MGALQKFEEETEAKAIKNAENLEVDAIGVDLLPEAGKEFMYTEFNRIGEELAEAENRKDRKAVRELKLEGANLIKAQNTIGQMLKDHAEDLLGVDGEGSYSGGSDATMMNMLINKEYTIRKEGKDMVIDFTGPNGKKGIKLEDLDEHIYLKKNDLAVNYDKAIQGVRNAANKGMPFDKNSFARVVKQTLNTTQKLVASMWDDNFTLKDGQTLKDLWVADPENAGKDPNDYLRTSGKNWNENAVRDFANKKLMQGGINDSISYKKKDKKDTVENGGHVGSTMPGIGWVPAEKKKEYRGYIDKFADFQGNYGNYVFDVEEGKYYDKDAGAGEIKYMTAYEVAQKEDAAKGDAASVFKYKKSQVPTDGNGNRLNIGATSSMFMGDGMSDISLDKFEKLLNSATEELMVDHVYTGFQQDRIQVLLDGKELGEFKVKFAKDEQEDARLEAQRFNDVLAQYFNQTEKPEL
jgi:hypothetical protein